MGLRYTAPAIYARENMEQISRRGNILNEDDHAAVRKLIDEELAAYPETNVCLITRGQTLSNVWNIVCWHAHNLEVYRKDFPTALADFIIQRFTPPDHPVIVLIRQDNIWNHYDKGTEQYVDIIKPVLELSPNHMQRTAIRAPTITILSGSKHV